MRLLTAFTMALAAVPAVPARAQSFGTLAARSTKCLDVVDGSASNGAKVQIWDCARGNTNQQWALSGTQLKTPKNKCLDVVDGRTQNGASVQLWDCVAGNKNQAWEIVGQAVRLKNTNLCLDVREGRFDNGGQVQLWTCDFRGTGNQVWVLGGDTSSSPGSNAGTNPSGYLQTSGTRIVDRNNKPLLLRGTNIGGWLVTEGWMNGYTDTSDKDPYRWSQETLERRFGAQTAESLLNTWRDNFFTSDDLDNLKNIGVNAIRVPFGYRNLQRADGSWIKNSAGNIDFGRLDWVVAEAGKRGIYTILDFHIWQGQKEDYSRISQNSDQGRADQAKAADIWVQVAKHFKGNANVAGFDPLNEPTGSYANYMQDAMYKAIRSVDADRIIFMESMNADPSSLKWKQVVYSIHQYGMMGTDFGSNQVVFQKDIYGDVASFRRFGIPTYVGEFMVQDSGPMLSWLLNQYNQNELHWTSWTYKTVDLGPWGLCNLSGQSRVNLLTDSESTIRDRWKNLGKCQPQPAVVDAFKKNLH